MDISPSIYEHAARFVQRSPWDVSRDAELLYRAHAGAYRYYRHTPTMPGIDIYNLEPEAYGATVERPDGDDIPAIGRHVFDTARALLALPPLNPLRDGRIPMLMGVARRLRDSFPEADIRVPISGPFSIASNLVGFNNLLFEAIAEPTLVADALMHLVDGQVAFAEAVKDAGVDVAFFESAACPPLLSPDLFRNVELPALKAVMGRIAEVVHHPVACIIGGNTEPILDMMVETGSAYLVCPFETDQARFLARIWDRTDIRLRVNGDLRVIAGGTWEQIKADADRLMKLVQGRPNVCLGTGALPFETPPENVTRLMEYVSGL
jgi:uroporphyrinogen decarboxylase